VPFAAHAHTHSILGKEPGANAALFPGVEGHRAGPSAGFTALLVLYTGINEIGRIYVKRKKKKFALWTVTLLHWICVSGRNLAEHYKSDNVFVFLTELTFFVFVLKGGYEQKQVFTELMRQLICFASCRMV
jgi:hypothetical protein